MSLSNTFQPFTPEEHARFITALETHGSGKKGSEWTLVTELVGTRTLYEVWQHAELYLKKLASSGNVAAAKPKISSGNWSWEENSIFEDALSSIGEASDRWKNISNLLPDKTMAACQKHYQLLLYDITRIETGEIATRQFFENHTQARTGAPSAYQKKGKGKGSRGK
tara:strand:+ start:120 stop:620 length:501 start_codon:yes stop_codon:yes gene_type:complete